MSRSVDEIQDILLTVEGIVHLYGMALNGYAALTLKIHIVEHLGLEVLGGDGVGVLKKSVGKCALAVVNMGYYTKIADILHTDCKVSNNFPPFYIRTSFFDRRKGRNHLSS